jgi:hypothetical protein
MREELDDPREEFLNDPRERLVDEPLEPLSPEQLRERWRATSTGLRWYFTTCLVKVGVLLVAGVGGYIAASDVTEESLAGLLTFLTIAVLCTLAVDLVGLFALTRIAQVPATSGARGRAWAAFVTGLIVVVIDLVMALPVITQDLEAMGEDSRLELVSRIGSIIMFLFLLGSLRAMASHLGRPEVEALGGRVMGLIGIIVAVAFVGGLVSRAAGSPALGSLMGLALIGLGVWAFVAFLIMLHKLAKHAAGEADVASAF